MKVALFDLSQLDPQEQTAALTDDPEPFVSYVVDQVRAAAESVISALAAMKAQKPKFHEDDLTGLMRMPLAAGVRFLRWTVAEQPPGGYSPRGNPGKRDLAIQCNGWTLAVIEALVCRNPVTYQSVKDDLTSHFQRLLGYFPGALFFHLTYSYVDEPSSVLSHLKLAAEREVSDRIYLQRRCQEHRADGFTSHGIYCRIRGADGPVESCVSGSRYAAICSGGSGEDRRQPLTRSLA